MSQVTAVTLSDGTVVNTFPNSIDGELVSRAFTELFAQIQSQATDIAENDAIIDQLRADLAARATAEQPEPDAIPYQVQCKACGHLDYYAAPQAPQKDAEQSRDSVIEECASKIQLLGDSWVPWDYVAELRALKSQQDAAIESQRSGDGS